MAKKDILAEIDAIGTLLIDAIKDPNLSDEDFGKRFNMLTEAFFNMPTKRKPAAPKKRKARRGIGSY